MRDPPSYIAATSDSLNSSTPSSSSSSSCSSSSPSSSVLSTLSSQTSSLSTSFTSYSPPPNPSLPTFSFLQSIRRTPRGSVPSKKNRRTKCSWMNKFFNLGKLSMEAAAHDEGLLLHKASEGFQGSWGDADEFVVVDKPKRELRFAVKIAAAMDADGLIGVKNSVCAEDGLIGVKHSVCAKEVNSQQFCVPSSPCILQRSERAPLKQARPRRRWKLFRRMRRSRVLFACMFRKIRKVFTSSSNRTLKSHDSCIK